MWECDYVNMWVCDYGILAQFIYEPILMKIYNNANYEDANVLLNLI